MKITIIGTGPGGYKIAVDAAKAGFDVVIVTDGPLGGACLNEGCIPTKTYCKNAELIEDLQKSDAYGLEDLHYKFNFDKVIERKNQIIEYLRGCIDFLLKNDKITLLQGKAVFKDKNTIIVNGQEYYSDYIIIATGSYSASLPIEGRELEGVITSKELLELPECPKRMCVIGAGVIGLEFASIFKSFGTEVTVLEYCKEILPHFDSDVAKRLKQCLGKREIKIENSAEVKKILQGENCLIVNYIKKGKEFSVEVDKVLMAVGRRPNIDSLNLADVGIEFSSKGIVVDKDMRTNIPNIFAVGDIIGGLMLAHAATFQGYKALYAIMSENNMEAPDANKIDLSIVPAAVFTIPEMGCVGMTEDKCKEAGIEYKCHKNFFRANGKALSMNEDEGYCKIISAAKATSEYKEGQILGCHMFGAHSSDLIQEIAVAMNHKDTIKEFNYVIHGHPTLTEVIQDAARKD